MRDGGWGCEGQQQRMLRNIEEDSFSLCAVIDRLADTFELITQQQQKRLSEYLKPLYSLKYPLLAEKDIAHHDYCAYIYIFFVKGQCGIEMIRVVYILIYFY